MGLLVAIVVMLAGAWIWAHIRQSESHRIEHEIAVTDQLVEENTRREVRRAAAPDVGQEIRVGVSADNLTAMLTNMAYQIGPYIDERRAYVFVRVSGKCLPLDLDNFKRALTFYDPDVGSARKMLADLKRRNGREALIEESVLREGEVIADRAERLAEEALAAADVVHGDDSGRAYERIEKVYFRLVEFAEDIRNEVEIARDRAGEDDVPDNPRFATWEEAINRPVTDDLRFQIEYADKNGEVTEREIEPRMIHPIPHAPEITIEAFCHLRQAMRTFYSARVLKCTNLATNRPIKDLGQYLRGRY